MKTAMTLERSAELFVEWLQARVLIDARGDEVKELSVAPSGRFWLGRIAPMEAVVLGGLGDRGERLDPCAFGVRVRARGPFPRACTARVRATAWKKEKGGRWTKCPPIDEVFPVIIGDPQSTLFGAQQVANSLADAVGQPGLGAHIEVSGEQHSPDIRDVTITLVNNSPATHTSLADTNLYQCSIDITDLHIVPFDMEALPDTFRYDRRIAAYGINCGVVVDAKGRISTCDLPAIDRARPAYWNVADPKPDLSFSTLAQDPLPSLTKLYDSLAAWGGKAWSSNSLDERAALESWTTEMRREAEGARSTFEAERERVATGLALLRTNEEVLAAFKFMNAAMNHAARGRYLEWRPFQVGFILATLRSLVDESESDIADIVWFATGGGKTETYLGLIVVAAFLDRLTGKAGGVTAWSRFPLRMLSLQQTQRFADAMAGAEIVRRQHSIPGSPFSVGFLVGDGATPNRIKLDPGVDDPDADDPEMPRRYRVLLRCPFCASGEVTMAFDRRHWRLQHQCGNHSNGCPWPDEGLPFYIVDDEIFRFLPTVIVGTLDKAASIGLQAAMVGLIGPPRGVCSTANHGYVYAPRSDRPTGCLVPGCRAGGIAPLPFYTDRFAPRFRLQDELHLLRDSLGAVDAHYESLIDHLEICSSRRRSKVLASSATLAGYQRQSDVLYQRQGRVFPALGPRIDSGFWTSETETLSRRFVALAPRGVTLEFAVDRAVTTLQESVRRLIAEPAEMATLLGIPEADLSGLIDLYGVDVLFANSLRDLDAAARSLETQVSVSGVLNTASLTGRTEFVEIMRTLARLTNPESSFDDRIHVVTASSMMSHGVDIDRLNVMVMLGLPLTTADFIQATARVGRRWPGLVFVLHKMARERDASVFRSFAQYVGHGDRLVEPVPITRRSRRVLERTLPGLAMARLYAVHEPLAGGALTTVARLRDYFARAAITAGTEASAAIEALRLTGPEDERIRQDVREWYRDFFAALNDPSGTIKFPRDLCPRGEMPMISLRDVEEQAPIMGMTNR